jgi:uncharacterized protein YegP (UPF0339 family)
MGYEIYQDKSGEWRWRLRSSNGQLVANGGEGFASKSNVIRALESVRKNAQSEGHVEIGEDGEPKS